MMYDVMQNLQSNTIKCLNEGHVTLIDCMPRLVSDERKTGDEAVIQAARVSYGLGLKSLKDDRNLIRYLYRHRHTTPTEMCDFKLHMKLPIVVARQWIRHRTASVNEISGRYTQLPSNFYLPNQDEVRKQSKNNKQGSVGPVDPEIAKDFSTHLEMLCFDAYKKYEWAINNGIGKEQARMLLPVNIYTEWYWKIDLKNLLDCLALRCDTHAQYEARVFADAILALITPIVPLCIEAWNDYHPYREAICLSRLEIKAIKDKDMNGMTDREIVEFLEKTTRLGI